MFKKIRNKIAFEVNGGFAAIVLTIFVIHVVVLRVGPPEEGSALLFITLPTLLIGIMATFFGYPIGFRRYYLKTGPPTSEVIMRMMSLAILRDAVIMFLLSLVAFGLIAIALQLIVSSGPTLPSVFLVLGALIPTWLIRRTSKRMWHQAKGTPRLLAQAGESPGIAPSTALVRLRLIPLLSLSMFGWLLICGSLLAGIVVGFSAISIAMIFLGVCFLALTPYVAGRTARSFAILPEDDRVE